MTLLLPGSLDAFFGIFLEVKAASFGEQVYFLYEASKSPPTVVEVTLPRSHVGSGLGPPLIREPAAVVPVVTCSLTDRKENT